MLFLAKGKFMKKLKSVIICLVAFFCLSCLFACDVKLTVDSVAQESACESISESIYESISESVEIERF